MKKNEKEALQEPNNPAQAIQFLNQVIEDAELGAERKALAQGALRLLGSASRQGGYVRLLKARVVSAKTGKVFNNLYIQVGDGNPICIDLVHWNAKVRYVLLAQAQEFVVDTRVSVVEED